MTRIHKERYCGCVIRTTLDDEDRATRVELFYRRKRWGCVLTLDPVNKAGKWDCNVWQEVYEDGVLSTYTAWHDGAVDTTDSVKYPRWVEGRIDYLRWSAATHQLDTEFNRLSKARTRRQFQRLARMLDALRVNPHLVERQKAGATLGWATCLARLGRAETARRHIRRVVPTLLDEDMHARVRVAARLTGSSPGPRWWRRLLAPWFLSQIDEIVSIGDLTEQTIEWRELSSRIAMFEKLGLAGELARSLLDTSSDPWLLHTLATHVGKDGDLEMAVELLSKARDRAPRNLEILGNLEALYLRLGEGEKASELRAVQRDLLTSGGEFHLKDGDERDRRVEELLARYNAVVNENYARIVEGDGSFDFEGAEETMPLAAELEKLINESWTFVHPWDKHRIFEIGRILSAGSAMYVGWLRDRKRYDEAVAYLEEVVSDREYIEARIESFPESAGNLLNNGIGACLDSGSRKHLTLARNVIRIVEELMPETDNANLLYSIACVSARLGWNRKALEYLERSLGAGFSSEWAAEDPDLVSLHDSEAFERLVGKG